MPISIAVTHQTVSLHPMSLQIKGFIIFQLAVSTPTVQSESTHHYNGVATQLLIAIRQCSIHRGNINMIHINSTVCNSVVSNCGIYEVSTLQVAKRAYSNYNPT